MKIFGFIPARLGSVRLVGKNSIEFGGKPLIQWTIDAAKNSKINRLIVCSDDPVCKNLAVRTEVEMWHQPNPFASGTEHASKICLWALERLWTREKYFPDAIMLLFPTSPFRETYHINAAIDLFDEGAASVISVKRARPIETLRYCIDGYLYPYVSFHTINKQTQDADETFEVNGAIFLTNTMLFQQYESFHIPMARPYLMPECQSIEIDTFANLEMARKFL